MATTSRDIITPDLDDLVKPTSQLAVMAQTVDDAIDAETDTIRFHTESRDSSLSVIQGWQSHTDTVFSPPSEWGLYRVMVFVVASVRDSTRLAGIQTQIRITTSGQNQDGPVTEDNAGANRAVAASAVWGDLSGDQRFVFRVQASDAAGVGAAVASSWMTITAARQT